jgi:hypothetical protein
MGKIEVGSEAVGVVSPPAPGSTAEEQWQASGHPLPPLRVEVPDESFARTLIRQLQPLDAESVAVDGYYEVGIELHERNPEQRVGKALSSIDAWLAASGLQSVRVHVEGCSHTLHVLPAREAAKAERAPGAGTGR